MRDILPLEESPIPIKTKRLKEQLKRDLIRKNSRKDKEFYENSDYEKPKVRHIKSKRFSN